MSLEPDEEFASPNPEARLFAAVLAQAVNDLFYSPGALADRSAKARTREESLRLLTDETGDWADHREFLCSMAGLDPVAFRQRILERLRRAPPEPIVTGRDRSDADRARKRDYQRRRHERLKAAKAAETAAAAILSPPLANAAE